MARSPAYLELARLKASRRRAKRHPIARLPTLDELLRVRAFLQETARTPYVGARDALICDFMRVYLLRVGETLSLNLHQFDFGQGTFTVDPVFEKCSKEKAYSLRNAPEWFREGLRRYLNTYHERFRDGFLFSTPQRCRGRPWLRPVCWIDARWNKAVRASGLWEARFTDAAGHSWGRLRTHHWRILGITRLLQRGYSPKEVQAFTQHECVETIMRYYWVLREATVRGEIMREAIQGLPRIGVRARPTLR